MYLLQYCLLEKIKDSDAWYDRCITLGEMKQYEEYIAYFDDSIKSLVPIHTVADEYHKKWHSNVTSVNPHGVYQL